MADRFKPLPIFPTLVHGFHLPNFKTDKDKFVKYIEEQRVKDPAGVQISNGGGWQSQATQSGQRSKLTTTLKKAILNYFDKEGIVMYTSLDKRDLNAAEEAKYHGANS